jgi:hypothetical protein
MDTKTSRRKVKDRRTNDPKQALAYPYNRRRLPCRRLDDISVEDVYMGTVVRRSSF